MASRIDLKRRQTLRTARSPRGFLLIEAMIASVVLAVAAIGVATLLATSYQNTAAMRESAIATSLARQMLEEIAAKPLTNPDGTESTGPDAGQITRSQYLSAGNYNGFSDSTTTMTTAAGEAVSAGDGGVFIRTVTVTYESNVTGTTAASGDFALVTVTVTGPLKQSVTLSRLLTKTSWQT